MTLDGLEESRIAPKAVWTGDEVLVWGGYSFEGERGWACPNITDRLSDGFTWSLEDDSWRRLPDLPIGAVYYDAALWAGGQMVLLGAIEPETPWYSLDPVREEWTALEGRPDLYDNFVAVSTGETVIVWGGHGGDGMATSEGGELTVADGSWTPLPQEDAPSPRVLAAGAWVGDKLFVWGGYGPLDYESASDGIFGHHGHFAGEVLADGAVYDPKEGRWSSIETPAWVRARGGARAIWTGEAVVLLGGAHRDTGRDVAFPNPVAWFPEDGRWQELPAPSSPSHSAVLWTGSEILAWADRTLERFEWGSDGWQASRAPKFRGHAAVWTGELLAAWGRGGEACDSLGEGVVFRP